MICVPICKKTGATDVQNFDLKLLANFLSFKSCRTIRADRPHSHLCVFSRWRRCHGNDLCQTSSMPTLCWLSWDNLLFTSRRSSFSKLSRNSGHRQSTWLTHYLVTLILLLLLLLLLKIFIKHKVVKCHICAKSAVTEWKKSSVYVGTDRCQWHHSILDCGKSEKDFVSSAKCIGHKFDMASFSNGVSIRLAGVRRGELSRRMWKALT